MLHSNSLKFESPWRKIDDLLETDRVYHDEMWEVKVCVVLLNPTLARHVTGHWDTVVRLTVLSWAWPDPAADCTVCSGESIPQYYATEQLSKHHKIPWLTPDTRSAYSAKNIYCYSFISPSKIERQNLQTCNSHWTSIMFQNTKEE